MAEQDEVKIAKRSNELGARDLFRSLPTPSILVDLEGRILDANHSMEKLFGKGRDELVMLWDLCAREEADKLRESFEKCKRDGFASCDLTAIKGIGFPATLDLATIRDQAGKLVCIVGALNVAKEDERLKHERLKREKWIDEQIIDRIGDSLVVGDSRGKVFKVSSGYERLTGYKREEVLGLDTLKLPGMTDEGREILKRMWGRVVAGEPVVMGEMPYITKSGKKIVVSATQSAAFGEDGEIAAGVFISRDITAVKTSTQEIARALKAASEGALSERVDLVSMVEEYRAIGEAINVMISSVEEKTEELRKREEELDFIFENSGAAMILLDEEGRWIKVNRALERDIGFPREELLGKKTPEQICLSDETIPDLKELWNFVIEKRREVAEFTDVHWKRRDGSTLVHSAWEVPYGGGVGRLYTAVDVTELRSREEGLTRAVNAFDEVLSKAATGDLSPRVEVNELSGSLRKIGEDINSMIQGLASMAKNIKATSEQLTASSEGIASSADQMNASTQQASYSFSQIAEGTSTQAARLVEMSSSAQEVMTLAQETANEAKSMAEKMEEASYKAINGAKGAEGAIASSDTLSKAISQTVEVVSSLGEKLSEVGEVLEIVTDITSKTTLLALNAAIEAARAGESGKAFAVVAEEIRRLAERSRENTRKIADMIKAIEEVPAALGRSEVAIAMFFEFDSGKPGHFFLFLREEHALNLLSSLLSRKVEEVGEFERSALLEIGNILAGAFLSGIANFLGASIKQIAPTIKVDMVGAILDETLARYGKDADVIWLTDIRFSAEGMAYTGQMVLIPFFPFMQEIISKAKNLVG
jgi:PAS domain S-box-containing protein